MRAGTPHRDRHDSLVWRHIWVVAALVIASLFLVGCGDSSEDDALAPSNLIERSEIAKYPEGSPERSFLSFWADLQYQAWVDTAAYYSPEFRDFIGTARLIGAKKVDASTFPLSKPEIVRIEKDGDDTTILYALDLPEGARELGSTTWRRVDGNWQMIYDSRLDAQLNQLARNEVEIKENGSVNVDPSRAPSPAASRAGVEASRLQAEFLERELQSSEP